MAEQGQIFVLFLVFLEGEDSHLLPTYGGWLLPGVAYKEIKEKDRCIRADWTKAKLINVSLVPGTPMAKRCHSLLF